MYNTARLLVLILPLLLLSLFWTGCSDRRRYSRYLIPNGYVGHVRIDFGVVGAPPLPLENEFFLLRIPSTGHLQTSTALETGSVTDEFYYVIGNQRHRIYSNDEDYPTGSPPPIPLVRGGSVGGEQSGNVYGPIHEDFFIGTDKQFNAYCDKHPHWLD
jgi:hypothetical protein